MLTNNNSSNNSRYLLPMILLGLIIAYGSYGRWGVVTNTVVDHPIRADAADYFHYAKNLSQSAIYSADREEADGLEKDALRAPGFPFFASYFYQGENMESVTSVLKAQTLLQCATFLVLTILCWWVFGAWPATIISLFVWTHPAFMSINTYFLTESLFLSSLILVLASFLFTLKYEDNMLCLILLGISLGLSALIRPTMEYYLLFLMPIILFRSQGYFIRYLPAIITFLVIVLLWKLRNYVAIGEFSDPHLMINGLLHGSYPNFMFNDIPESYGFPYRFDPEATNAYAGVTETLAMIWQRAMEAPGEYLNWYAIGKQLYLWQWNILAGAGDVYIYPTVLSPIQYQLDLKFWHDVHRLINAPIMVIGVIGAYLMVIQNFIKRSPIDISFIIASIIVYASLFHVVVAPFPRYGIAFKVLVIIVFVQVIGFLIRFLSKALRP